MKFGGLVSALMVVVFLTACSEPRSERLLTSRTTSPQQNKIELIDDQPTLPDKLPPGDHGLRSLPLPSMH